MDFFLNFNYIICMRKIFIIILLFSISSALYSGEKNIPGYEYVYQIENEKDLLFIFEKIQKLIIENNYCSYRTYDAEEENNGNNVFVIIRDLAMFGGGERNQGIRSLLYYNNKKLVMFFSTTMIWGIVNEYKEDERKKIWDGIYDQIKYNLLK